MTTTFIRASAGSGKTYTLTTAIAERIRKGQVSPSELIAVTFTRRAGAELVTKTAQRLLELGLPAEAQQLPAALIGTINSVAAQIVTDAAIDGGLSPRTRTIEPAAAETLLNASADAVLSEALDEPANGAATRLRLLRLGYGLERSGQRRYWAQDALDLARAARTNGLTADDLESGIHADVVDAIVTQQLESDDDAATHPGATTPGGSPETDGGTAGTDGQTTPPTGPAGPDDAHIAPACPVEALSGADRSWLLVSQAIRAAQEPSSDAGGSEDHRHHWRAALDAAIDELIVLEAKVRALADIVDQVVQEGLKPGNKPGKTRLNELINESEHRDLGELVTYAGSGEPKALNPARTSHRTTAERLARGVAALQSLRREVDRGNDRVPWSTWETIARGAVQPAAAGGCLKHALTERHALDETGAAVLASVQLQEDLREYLALSYRIAGRVLEAYAAAKAERGVMDFTDQEALALHLLETSPRARESLAGRYRLLAVDEFQDTSPLQMALYLRLTEIIRDVIWVGDPKQSIYRFRGTDPSLMLNVAREIQSVHGDHPVFHDVEPAEPLSSSYRSWKHPLDLSNAVSRRLFRHVAGQEAVAERGRIPVPARPERGWREEKELVLTIPEEHRAERAEGTDPGVVELWLPRPDAPTPAEDGSASALAPGADKPHGFRVDDALTIVAEGVARLLEEEAADVGTQVSPIAVLCRTNTQVRGVARALDDLGIPVSGVTYSLADTREGQVIDAALAYLVDASDTIALATLVDRLLDPVDGTDWFTELASQADHDARTALLQSWRERTDDAGRAPIDRLDRLRHLAALLTPRELVTEVIVATGLDDLTTRYPNPQRRRARVDDALDLAQAYDDACASQDEAVSVQGLRQHLAETSGELPVQSGPGAVEVLTIHRAKGLSWRTVVCLVPSAGEQAAPTLLVPAAGFDATRPLEGRRVLLTGAHDHAPSALKRLIQAHPEVDRYLVEDRAEDARLMYVALTRSEHRTVLVLRSGTVTGKHVLTELGLEMHVSGASGLLGAEPGSPVSGHLSVALSADADGALPSLTEPDVVDVVVRGLPWRAEEPEPDAEEPGSERADMEDAVQTPFTVSEALATLAGSNDAAGVEDEAAPSSLPPVWTDAPHVPDGPSDHLAARFQASATTKGRAAGRVLTAQRLGEPLPYTRRSAWNEVGDAVHAYLALPHAGLDEATAMAAAERILAERGMSSAGDSPLTAPALVEAGRRWSAWLTERFGPVTEATEVPITWTTEDNQVMEGRIDSLVTAADGRLVLADHKSTIIDDPVSRIEEEYLGQMSVYRESIRLATGHVPDAVVIHMPLRGEVYEIVFGEGGPRTTLPRGAGHEAVPSGA